MQPNSKNPVINRRTAILSGIAAFWAWLLGIKTKPHECQFRGYKCVDAINRLEELRGRWPDGKGGVEYDFHSPSILNFRASLWIDEDAPAWMKGDLPSAYHRSDKIFPES